jgi:hypothetical protein
MIDGYFLRAAKAWITKFNDTVAQLGADEVQTAIEKLKVLSDVSASPGFVWTRSGNTPSGTWLQNGSVPSNLSGSMIPVSSGEIREIFVAAENSDTFTIEVFKRVGASFTSLATISLSSQRTKVQSYTGVTVTYGDELACQQSAGSSKNPVVGVVIKGKTS